MTSIELWNHCENPYPFVPAEVLDAADSVRASLPSQHCDPEIAAKMSLTMLLAVVKELVPIMQLLRGKATQNITKHTLAQRISIIYEKRVRALKPADAKAIEAEFAKVDA